MASMRTIDGQIDIGAFEAIGDLIFADGFDTLLR